MFCVTAKWNTHQCSKCVSILMFISNQGISVWFWTSRPFQCFAEPSYQMFIISLECHSLISVEILTTTTEFISQTKQTINKSWMKLPTRKKLGMQLTYNLSAYQLLDLRPPWAKQKTCNVSHILARVTCLDSGSLSRWIYRFALLITVSTSWVLNRSDDDGVWFRSCGKLCAMQVLIL